MSEQIYMIAAPNGSGYYYLLRRTDSYLTAAWLADGEPMTQPHPNHKWWFSPTRAEVITHVRRGTLNPIGYRIKDEAAVSERFPAQLTVEEFGALEKAHGEDVLWSLYERIAEELPGERTDYPAADFIDLGEAEPAPDDGLTWIAEIPFELHYYPEVRHLFPGKLIGFREVLERRLKAIPGVKAYNNAGAFEIYVELRYEPPRTEWKGALLRSGGRSKSRGAEVERRVTRNEKLSPPHHIVGPNRVAATKLWHELMDRWVAEVTDYATVRICDHCDGVGIAKKKIGGVA